MAKEVFIQTQTENTSSLKKSFSFEEDAISIRFPYQNEETLPEQYRTKIDWDTYFKNMWELTAIELRELIKKIRDEMSNEIQSHLLDPKTIITKTRIVWLNDAGLVKGDIDLNAYHLLEYDLEHINGYRSMSLTTKKELLRYLWVPENRIGLYYASDIYDALINL